MAETGQLVSRLTEVGDLTHLGERLGGRKLSRQESETGRRVCPHQDTARPGSPAVRSAESLLAKIHRIRNRGTARPSSRLDKPRLHSRSVAPNVSGDKYCHEHVKHRLRVSSDGTAPGDSMRQLIYLSEAKLGTFFPKRASRSVQFGGNLGAGPISVKIDMSDPSWAGPDGEISRKLAEVIKDLERQVKHFSSFDLSPGDWIFFDLKMGYGTSYRDNSPIPPVIDDIALFYGSLGDVETEKQLPLDLLLCGSTKHLRTRTESAGRLGSGTEWLDDLIKEIEELDSLGTADLPRSLSPAALAKKRVNMPEEIARWVFHVIRYHHSPFQYYPLQGFAQILFVVPRSEICPRLVLATPLFVQFASPKPLGIMARRRLQRELARQHGLLWGRWKPELPPQDRGKFYIPAAEQGSSEEETR